MLARRPVSDTVLAVGPPSSSSAGLSPCPPAPLYGFFRLRAHAGPGGHTRVPVLFTCHDLLQRASEELRGGAGAVPWARASLGDPPLSRGPLCGSVLLLRESVGRALAVGDAGRRAASRGGGCRDVETPSYFRNILLWAQLHLSCLQGRLQQG